jgi:hypothetical protein
MTLPPPADPISCTNTDCALPDGGVCARGEEHTDPLATCPNLVRIHPPNQQLTPVLVGAMLGQMVGAAIRKQAGARPPRRTTSDSAPSPTDSTSAAPWSGRHMSEAEADRLMWSSPARVIGVVGPHSAGKTCLLTSLFLLLADGQCDRLPYRFAGSRTLFALQTLGHELGQWDGSDGQMVAHTPRGEGSTLGTFLHLGLRPRNPADDRLVDLLLCDMAGEHFSDLATHADDDARARMAFLARCDGFIFVVDAKALFSDKGRRLDAELARMLGRLVDLLSGRPLAPLAVVVAKIDAVPQIPRPPADGSPLAELRHLLKQRAPRLGAALDRAEQAAIPLALFPVSAIPAEGQPLGVQDPFGYLLASADRRAAWPRWQAPIRPNDHVPSFMAFRSWRDER